MKLSDVVTDYDGKTLDTGRCIAVAVIAAMLVFEGVAVWKSQSFDAQAFGTGMGAVLAALGFAIAGDNHRRPPDNG